MTDTPIVTVETSANGLQFVRFETLRELRAALDTIPDEMLDQRTSTSDDVGRSMPGGYVIVDKRYGDGSAYISDCVE